MFIHACFDLYTILKKPVDICNSVVVVDVGESVITAFCSGFIGYRFARSFARKPCGNAVRADIVLPCRVLRIASVSVKLSVSRSGKTFPLSGSFANSLISPLFAACSYALPYMYSRRPVLRSDIILGERKALEDLQINGSAQMREHSLRELCGDFPAADTLYFEMLFNGGFAIFYGALRFFSVCAASHETSLGAQVH